MEKLENFKIGASYKFNTVAPTVLEGEYKNMILLSMMTAEEAVPYIDVYGIHSQVKQLPNVIIPTKASDLHYLKFKSVDGNILYIALEYLTGVELITNKQLLITVNNYTASDYKVIEETLRKLGFEDIAFELVDK